MMDTCCSTLAWLLLGVGFVAAAAGITWVLIILSTGRDDERCYGQNGARDNIRV